MNPEGPNPSGLCMCGCGEKTNLARKTDNGVGVIKNEPRRFLPGHNAKLNAKPKRPPKLMRREGPPQPSDYIVDPETGCWNWAHAMSPHGYGMVRHEGVKMNAHRFYYIATHGPVPRSVDIDHLCRNRRCVNPEHLEAVSRAENIRRGLGAKLLPSEVAAIRMLGRGEQCLTGALLSELFSISQRNVYTILAGQSWRDLRMTPELLRQAHAIIDAKTMAILRRQRGLRLCREEVIYSGRLF